jgi:hypothetical protein
LLLIVRTYGRATSKAWWQWFRDVSAWQKCACAMWVVCPNVNQDT